MDIGEKAKLHPGRRRTLGGCIAMAGAGTLRLILEGASARAQAIDGSHKGDR